MSWKVTITVLYHGQPHLQTAFDRSPITLGATPQNDVLLNDPFVSGEHAEIMVSRGQIVFRDKSTNGSFFEGERITEKELGQQGRIEIPPFELDLALVVDSNEWRTAFRQDVASLLPSEPRSVEAETPTDVIQPPPITGGFARPAPADRADLPGSKATPETPTDVIREPAPGGFAGPRELRPLEAPPVPSPNAPAVQPPEATVVLPAAGAACRFRLRVTQGPSDLVGSLFELPDRRVVLGRIDSADLQLNADTISRAHASFEPMGDGVLVRDLNSSNGCTVGGQRVAEALLEQGDSVRLGAVVLEAQLVDEKPRSELERPQPPRVTPPRATPSVAELEVTARPAEGNAAIILIDVRGRVDGYNYTQLADVVDAAIEDGGRYLIVDLGQVDFMSHTGLGVFVKSLARLRRLHGELCLVGLSQRLRDAISLANLDSMFHKRLAETREQALAAWRSRG